MGSDILPRLFLRCDVGIPHLRRKGFLFDGLG